jgi:sialate O-acetylesterase
MAFLLENAFNGSALIADADDHPSVRLFTSKKTSSRVPLLEQPAVEEAWAVSSANATSDDSCPKCPNNTFPPALGPTVADWAGLGSGARVQDHTEDDNWLYMSAVCYIYGKSIQAHTGKPVGLVNTNWGGTPVEFWM